MLKDGFARKVSCVATILFAQHAGSFNHIATIN
jgi:hypothetical protein